MQALEVAGVLKANKGSKFLILGDVPFSYSVVLKAARRVRPENTVLMHESTSSLVSSVSADPDFMGSYRTHVFLDMDAESSSAVLQAEDLLPAGDILIVTCPRKLGNNKSYTRLKASMLVVEEPELKEYGSDYDEWVQSLWRGMKITFSPGASSALLERVSKDRLAILKATRVLLLYSRERKISEYEIGECFPGAAVSNFFEFLDDFMNKRVRKVLGKIEGSKESESVGLVRSLLSEASKVHQVSVFLQEKVKDDEIASTLGIHPWALKSRYKKAAAAYGQSRLIRVLDLLTSAEVLIKSSKFAPKQILKAQCLKAMR